MGGKTMLFLNPTPPGNTGDQRTNASKKNIIKLTLLTNNKTG